MDLLTVLSFLGAGAFGSLAKDCIEDGALQLPYVQEKKLILGFVGGMFVGAFVGLAIDQSLITALLSGYAGTSAIERLLPRVDKKS